MTLVALPQAPGVRSGVNPIHAHPAGKVSKSNKDNTFAPVAQLDRASVFGTEGWGFESLRAYFLPPAAGRPGQGDHPPARARAHAAYSASSAARGEGNSLWFATSVPPSSRSYTAAGRFDS